MKDQAIFTAQNKRIVKLEAEVSVLKEDIKDLLTILVMLEVNKPEAYKMIQSMRQAKGG